ncbi:MAG TPA: isoprenylcysteine carboxylmethyltransferase family protein [Pyrinomonadaceae bacterium]
MNVRQSSAVYFAFQSAAVVVWWLLLIFFPESRAYFRMGDSDATLFAFWLPDLLLIGVGSFAAATLCYADSKLASAAMWFVAGAISYAALYCLAFALLNDSGWLGVALMFPTMLWSGVFAVALSKSKDFMFRTAAVAATNWILTKTAIQIVVVWTLILFIIPYFILQLEEKLGIGRFTFSGQKTLAAILFVTISLLGLSSANVMSKIGRGTPLPLDAARNLVIVGAYAYVRNPMAISGVGQGLTVALWTGSPLVLIYALMGGAIWQVIFRPLEEEDLGQRFGTDYENYRRNVRCWIPHLQPYQIEATAASSNSIELPSGKI